MKQLHQHEGRREHERHGGGRHHSCTQVLERDAQHDETEHHPEENRVAHAGRRLLHERRLVVDGLQLRPAGKILRGLERRQLHSAHDVGRARSLGARDRDEHRLAARPSHRGGALDCAFKDRSH